MPWRGFEPRRLSALPPQDSVSTNFTTRAGPAEDSGPPDGGQAIQPLASQEVTGQRCHDHNSEVRLVPDLVFLPSMSTDSTISGRSR